MESLRLVITIEVVFRSLRTHHLIENYEDLSVRSKETGAAVKVRELVAMLAKANPDDIVAIDADAKCLLLLNQRLGMFPPLDENDARAATLTECDKEFLRALRVRF